MRCDEGREDARRRAPLPHGLSARSGRAKRCAADRTYAERERPSGRFATMPSRMIRAGSDSQTVRGARLAVAKKQTAFPVVRPAKRYDLTLAASRQKQQTDRGNLVRIPPGVHGKPRGQPSHFVIGKKSFTSLAAVTPDAPARVRSFRPEIHPFRFSHDHGQDWHGTVGRDRRGAKAGEPVLHLLPVNLGNRTACKVGQELVLQVASIYVKRLCLPDTLMLPEHGLGDDLEQRLVTT